MSFLALAPSHAFDLNSICSETLNASFCSHVLTSDPLVTKSLLHSPVYVTVDLANSNATVTGDHLVQWQKRTDNPQLRARYTSCSSNYNDAIADFQQARQSVGLGDYSGLRDAASGALGEFNGCADKFRQPPAEPSTLWQDTWDLLDLSSMVLVISRMLLQPY
ncbi:pectinesterase inhibitor [Prunus yedoensis var. nudiflora]|uniref:Pectinesterase inhibitor n=1 Tax=Prunus yedoensis var. nudiflora TaxID=2094558 RepID=A0A314ZH17_PRUYE|nr:pectinesterase inhibitor [Prunus yedoensis var. nudiflora]